MWLARYVSFLRAWARARPGIFVGCARLFTLAGWKWSVRVRSDHGQTEQIGTFGRASWPVQAVGTLKGIRPQVAMRQRSPKQEPCLLARFQL